MSLKYPVFLISLALTDYISADISSFDSGANGIERFLNQAKRDMGKFCVHLIWCAQ
ncbi:MAG: hypothetical protein IBX57_07850 [Gammaproteobacteria bacterium]|nr:hypothetical protein [Gammaproteobacteria bacterium]